MKNIILFALMLISITVHAQTRDTIKEVMPVSFLLLTHKYLYNAETSKKVVSIGKKDSRRATTSKSQPRARNARNRKSHQGLR